ncbi:MAG: hypothetical protein J7501_05570 [Bdellovibrio sp.]|nr:hypothetical protein [Bdellovibrio sp.]
MIKFAVIISAVLMSVVANAKSVKCEAAVNEELQYRSEAEGFDVEGISAVSKKEAQALLKSARKDQSTEQERALAIEFSNQANKEFYVVQWNAQSNFGTTVTVVDTINCEIKAEIIHDSQE